MHTEPTTSRPHRTVRSADGARIRYTVAGDGPAMVLLHGYTDSLETWIESGYAAGLAGRRLILIDARGHGGSDRPHDPESYAPELRAADVAAVMDAEGVGVADLLGYSMGGWGALAFYSRHPERVRRAAVGGAHPFAQSLEPLRAMFREGPGHWRAWVEREAGLLPGTMTARMSANDAGALAACIARDRAEMTATLAGTPTPFLFYAGARDPLREACAKAAVLPRNGRYVEVLGANHVTAFLRSDLVLPILDRFFAD